VRAYNSDETENSRMSKAMLADERLFLKAGQEYSAKFR
jgi:hypothetical protein